MSLFGDTYPNAPGFKKGVTKTSNRTSIAVAADLHQSGRAQKNWEIVLAWFQSGHKATPDECAFALKWPVTSVRPRCTQLLEKELLRETGKTRRTASGHDAYVLEAV
jgi:hypothetical protein